MGHADHIRLGDLPHKRNWEQVVALLDVGAGPSQIASATITAAQRGLKLAMKDPRLAETVWLLSQLPGAAASGNFSENLRSLGFDVNDAPGLVELTGAFSDALDARMAGKRGETDFGEMAQMAAVETIFNLVGGQRPNIVELTSADVQYEISKMRTTSGFGALAGQFLARLAYKTLDYFLSRTFAQHIGEGKRFPTVRQKRQYAKSLEHRCIEAALAVEAFSGAWFSRTIKEKGSVSKEDAASFVRSAMTKMVAELKSGGQVRPRRQAKK